MKHTFCKSVSLFITVFMLMLFTGCGTGEIERAEAEFSDTYSASDTWTIYWYLCGSDLESEIGAASADLEELTAVKLPSNVRVIIQTGGAMTWHTNGIPNNGIGRYLYDSEGLHAIETLPDADMGKRDTLASFLKFGQEQYPADHRVFLFWDHGGGSAIGVCKDERTGSILSLDDIRYAFEAAHTPDYDKPPFELIGFDACLMATVDMAHDLYGLGRYMVASEELEPGNGWNYTGWLDQLGKNPAMGGAALGKVMCDTYIEGCQQYSTEEAATLSVVDLGKLPELRTAYANFGIEALRAAEKNPRSFFSAFSREAESSENYGGNTREQGYTNMVDMKSLAKNAQKLLPQSADPLIAAIDSAVIYKVNGPYRHGSSGLSCYYSYNGDADNLQRYASQLAPLMPFKCLYYFLLFGELPHEASQYLTGSAAQDGSGIENAGPGGSTNIQPINPPASQQKLFQVERLEDTPVDVDDEGTAFVRLTPEQMDILSSVHCQFFYQSVEDDIILYLGSDANIDADWDKGVFKDNFQGKWPMLDGHPVYIEITQEGDDYNLYSVPVRLNGVECNLQIVYNFKDEKYHIMGARKGLEASGMGDRNLIRLKAGDRITTLHYAMTISGDDEEFQQFDMDTFTLGENPKFDDEDVGDGKYGYYFEFVDPVNKTALSRMVMYTIENGQIVTSVGDDEPGGSDGAVQGGGIAGSMTGGGSSQMQPANTGGSIADSLHG